MILSHGYDFSAYQGTKVPKAQFGWVKTSEGIHYKNSKFDAQWNSALANWDAPGVYHYAHPEKSTPAKQVAMISSMVELTAGRHTVMLDLEASELTQAKTNGWAKEFGAGLRDTFSGVRTVLYMGGGYATNGTGKGLADHFDHWCFPQYPGAYRIPVGPPGLSSDELRAANRSSLDKFRAPLSAPKSNWPASMGEMSLPANANKNTGWKDGPDYWQFTDNHAPGGLDASVTPMTVAEILGNEITPMEGIELYGGTVLPGDYEDMSYPHGGLSVVGIFSSSDEPVTGTVEVNHKDKQTTEKVPFTVGGPRLPKGGRKKFVYKFKDAKDGDALTITNNGPAKIGWDAQ